MYPGGSFIILGPCAKHPPLLLPSPMLTPARSPLSLLALRPAKRSAKHLWSGYVPLRIRFQVPFSLCSLNQKVKMIHLFNTQVLFSSAQGSRGRIVEGDGMGLRAVVTSHPKIKP